MPPSPHAPNANPQLPTPAHPPLPPRRKPIPRPLPEGLGATPDGWISIFTLGASLIASTFFSEAMWQRVWASEGRETLRGGAVIGFFLTTALIFVSGFGGWLALVAGYVKPDTNPDLYFFQVGRWGRGGGGRGWEERG
jgi:SSS family solute:Na+ symporter